MNGCLAAPITVKTHGWHEYYTPYVSVISGVNLPQRVYRLNRFLQNLAWGERRRFPSLHQFSPLWLLKCELTAPKTPKLQIFGINFSDFYKIWRGEGVPGPHRYANFQHGGFTNVGLPLTAAKIAKNSNFLYKFAPNKNPEGP